MSRPPRVLCVRRGGLGDTLLMTPVLRALRRAHPDAELHIAGVREFAALLPAHGVVAAAFSSEDLGSWRLAAGTTPPLLARYELVVADDPALRAARGPRVQCFDPRPVDGRPLGQQLAAQLGLTLQWPQDAWLAEAPRTGGDDVVLAPGSGGAAKCWPRAHWCELASLLAGTRHRTAVLVGPVEQERDDPRAWPWPVPVAFVCEPDLVVVARRLAAARAFVGNDSGTTHLAAMLGVPTVALFGPSDARVFAPIGPRVCALEASDRVLAALAPATVHRSLTTLLG